MLTFRHIKSAVGKHSEQLDMRTLSVLVIVKCPLLATGHLPASALSLGWEVLLGPWAAPVHRGDYQADQGGLALEMTEK